MLEEQIEQWIDSHTEELILDLEKLVRIPSVSHKSGGTPVYGEGCAQALRCMLDLGKKYGLDTRNADDYCGVTSLGSSERKIGIWGHLDVVPEGGGWSYPPYECTRIGDFVIGRGVQDNKGPCVAGLYALRCLKELKIPLRHTICQIVGCAEETGMDDVEHFLREFPAPDFSFITDCGFPVCYGEKGILEAELVTSPLSDSILDFYGGTVSNSVPDSATMVLRGGSELLKKSQGLPLQISAVSDCSVTVTAKGKSRHAAFPQGSVNAIATLLTAVLDADMIPHQDRPMLEAINAVCASTDGSALGVNCSEELSGPLTCVGGVVRLQAHKAALQINVRYPIFTDRKELNSRFYAGCARLGFQAETLRDSAPNYFPPDSDSVKTLTDVYRRVTGDNREPFVMAGGTYARKIPNAVAFGPGMDTDFSPLKLPDGHGSCHSPDEAQSIPNLLKALKIYVLALIELDRNL